MNPAFDDIDTLGKFKQLTKRGHKGHFICQKCGRDLTSLLDSLPNDGEDRYMLCPNQKCKNTLRVNAAVLAYKQLRVENKAQ